MAKILIVEDESFVADLYAHVLQKEGLEVKIAGNAQDALNLLNNETFDLVLLDILLPGMSGLQLLRHWRERDPQSQMAVILLSNLGEDNLIKEGFELGARGYLIKSTLTPQQVVEEVKTTLEGTSEI